VITTNREGNGTQQCITMTEMSEAADSSEIYVIIFPTTNYHIPQYSYLNIKVKQNLTSEMAYTKFYTTLGHKN
jgi:hypothetical protein